MFLYLGGVWTPPCLYAPIHLYTPIYLYTSRGVHTPIGPHALLYTCMVLEHLHVVGGCYLLKCVLGQLPYTTLIWGCLPLNYTPHSLHCWFPVYCYSQGYWFLMWAFPLLLKGLGCSPITWEGWWAHQLSSCPCAHSCTYFCSALCLTFRPQLQLLLLQLLWYLLACHQCHQ